MRYLTKSCTSSAVSKYKLRCPCFASLILTFLPSSFLRHSCHKDEQAKKKNGCDPTSDALPALPPPLTLPLIFFYSPSFLPSKCWNKHENINSYILKHNAPIEVSSFYYSGFSVFPCWKLSSYYFKPFSVFLCDVLHILTICILYRRCQLKMSRQREINVRPFILVSSVLAIAEMRRFSNRQLPPQSLLCIPYSILFDLEVSHRPFFSEYW